MELWLFTLLTALLGLVVGLWFKLINRLDRH